MAIIRSWSCFKKQFEDFHKQTELDRFVIEIENKYKIKFETLGRESVKTFKLRRLGVTRLGATLRYKVNSFDTDKEEDFNLERSLGISISSRSSRPITVYGCKTKSYSNTDNALRGVEESIEYVKRAFISKRDISKKAVNENKEFISAIEDSVGKKRKIDGSEYTFHEKKGGIKKTISAYLHSDKLEIEITLKKSDIHKYKQLIKKLWREF